MSFWQLGACVEGYNKANGGDSKPEAPTDSEFDNLLKMHNVYH